MRVDFAYGKQTRSVLVPAGVDIDYVTPRQIDGIDNIAEALRRACRQPVDAPTLSDLVAPGKKITVLVADLTRSGGTKEILPAMVELLKELGAEKASIRILIARGTHRKLSKEEKQFFRSGVLQGLRVEEHDCDDASKCAALLLTKRGTPVRVHRWLRGSDLVLIVAPVSFHYFAGFGGGRKLILPGCSERVGIMANHRLSLQDTQPVELHPACRPAILDGNPVNEDMCEAMSALSNVYAVNFFGDTRGNTVYVNAGDPLRSHLQACEVYSGLHCVPSPLHDVLILGAGGWPHDLNLLQAHKALKHGIEGARAGSAVLFFAECGEGIGSQSLATAIGRPRSEFFKDAYKEYDLNNQTAVSLLGMTDRYRVAMVTDLDDEALVAAGIERCTNPEAFLAEALEETGANRVGAIPYGAQTLPYRKEG